MTPVEVAAAVYSKEHCARSFKEDLEAHLLNGHVHSTDQYFIMGRKVRRDAPHADIVNPWVKHANPDCWLVYLHAGNMRLAFEAADVRLPFVCFEKRNRLKFYTWEEIHKRTERFFA
jgi:hypothetical protein